MYSIENTGTLYLQTDARTLLGTWVGWESEERREKRGKKG